MNTPTYETASSPKMTLAASGQKPPSVLS
jgi:hypothetical protein